MLLPSAPGFSIRNVVLAAYSSCSYPKNVFTGFIVSHVLYTKTQLSVKAGSIFSFSNAWLYRSQKFAHALIIGVDNVIKLNV